MHNQIPITQNGAILPNPRRMEQQSLKMTKTPPFLIILALAATQATAAERVLGKLGQTIEPTKIYSRPSSSSRVYYRANAYEYLVIRAGKSKTWLQVVMERGIIAYIKADSVARLPHEVTVEEVNTPSRMARVVPTSSRSAAAAEAARYHGTPYKWGGNDLYKGIDCSGFVKKLYGMIGISLPRTAAEQALVGQPITRLEDLQPGDRLYFWEKKRNKIGHTGIYTGNGYFYHSSVGKGGVDQDYLSERWLKILVAARR